MSRNPVVAAGPLAQTSSIEIVELVAAITFQDEGGVLLHFIYPPMDPVFWFQVNRNDNVVGEIDDEGLMRIPVGSLGFLKLTTVDDFANIVPKKL
jgi:hypothetical protein